MKTAISIPNEIFETAELTAKYLGVSRSELYATAVREFVARYRRDDVTAKLNALYGSDKTSSHLDPALQVLQARSVDETNWK